MAKWLQAKVCERWLGQQPRLYAGSMSHSADAVTYTTCTMHCYATGFVQLTSAYRCEFSFAFRAPPADGADDWLEESLEDAEPSPFSAVKFKAGISSLVRVLWFTGFVPDTATRGISFAFGAPPADGADDWLEESLEDAEPSPFPALKF